MSDDLRSRLEAIAARERQPAPEMHSLPQLYRLAINTLDVAARVSGHWAFTEDDARRALANAGQILGSPTAANFGEQPDPADVGAFIARLQADEIVTTGPDGFGINQEALPY